MGIVTSIVAIIVGLALVLFFAERLVKATAGLAAALGVSAFFLSMVFLGFDPKNLAVGVARELPAAMRRRPEISYGNVNGSVLTFFLFNAGIISLAHPINVERQTLWFYLPMALGAIGLVSLFLMAKRISRWAGAVLALVYVVFAVGGYVLFDASPGSPGRQ